MVGCSATQCTNRSSHKSLKQLEREKNKAITFHKFPKEVKRRSLWVKAVHRKNWLPNENSRLCSEHFEVDCFYKYFDDTIHLRGDALPTRFAAFPDHVEKRITVDECETSNVNITPFLDNSSIKKKEFVEQEYIDDKVRIWKSVDMNNCVRDHEKNQCDISAVDIVKIEPSSSEVRNYKTENDICEMDYQFNNSLSFCSNCQGAYRHYCVKCGMLVCILNGNAKDGGRIPEHILELRECKGRLGIFALTSVPKDVRFGPFTGLATSGRSWRLKGGRFVASSDESHFMNWMQYVNPVGDGPEHNLVVSRCDDELYYRSVRKIKTDEELLVCLGAGSEDSLNDNAEVDFVPVAEDARIAYACTFCCLGFSSIGHLINHKTVCTKNLDGRMTIKELMQCPFCYIYLEKREYSEYHMAYCQERNDGRRKTKKFQAIENSDDDIQNEEEQRFSTSDDSKERLSVGVRSSQTDGTKQFECLECRFRTKYRSSLKNHAKSKHLREFNYECQSCEYRSILRRSFEHHVKSKHLKEFRYVCECCRYQTNYKVRLENHVRSKHRVKDT